jgi:putative peptidoglycan lipid II flippase
VVAVGILLSRVMGLVRQRAVAHYFGISPWADVFTFALRAPNALQNLLGEGTLSASFIPVYSRMLEEGRREACSSPSPSWRSSDRASSGRAWRRWTASRWR